MNHRRFRCAQNVQGDLDLKVAPVDLRGMLLPDLYRASESGWADVIERYIVWCFLCAISWSMYTARKTAKSNTETQISGRSVQTLQFYHAQSAYWHQPPWFFSKPYILWSEFLCGSDANDSCNFSLTNDNFWQIFTHVASVWHMSGHRCILAQNQTRHITDFWHFLVSHEND